MNIVGNEDFESTGNTIAEVRNLLRAMDVWFHIEFDDYMRKFGQELNKPVTLFDKLVKLGYLDQVGFVTAWSPDKQSRVDTNEPTYRISVKGGALKNASAARPIKRTTAQKALAGFLDRVLAVNSDPYSIWTVRKVVLFGSMLDETRDPVSDVDLAILFRNHFDRRDEAERTGHFKYKDWRMIPFDPDGKYKFESDVKRFLRNRSRVLSMGILGSGLEEDGTIGGLPIESTPHRIVFEAE